jgi:hypothetical protein
VYLDLELRCRTDGDFRHRLRQGLKRMDGLQDHPAQRNDALMDFIKLCNNNLILLTGYFFPRYPEDRPMTFAEYPFAFQMFDLQVGGYKCFKGSRQIAKSTAFAARQILQANLYPGWKSMYLCTRSQYLATYTQRFRELERASIFPKPRDQGDKLRRNLNLKEYATGSSIEMAYVLDSAHNVRSKSASELLIDEAQHFEPDLEIEVHQVQAASKTPVTIYAGTSLTTDIGTSRCQSTGF